MVIPNVIDSKTINLCQRFLALVLQKDKAAYKYMCGPKGARSMITKDGWTKWYANAVESLLHQHPAVFAIVADNTIEALWGAATTRILTQLSKSKGSTKSVTDLNEVDTIRCCNFRNYCSL